MVSFLFFPKEPYLSLIEKALKKNYPISFVASKDRELLTAIVDKGTNIEYEILVEYLVHQQKISASFTRTADKANFGVYEEEFIATKQQCFDFWIRTCNKFNERLEVIRTLERIFSIEE